MKFKCKGNDLLKGLNIAEKAIPNRSSLPVLENVYLDVSKNQLTLLGNDLEIGIKHSMPIQNQEMEGKLLLKSKTLSNILSKLANEEITVEADDKNHVKIGTEKVEFDLLGQEAESYPTFPTLEQGNQFSVTCQELKELIKHTLYAVSFDETKQFLNGILFRVEDKSLSFIATDGYRLAIKKLMINQSIKDCNVIVPYKAMNELNKILQQKKPEDTVQVNLSENQVGFVMSDILILTRIIQGQFPDYKQVLPKETNNQYTIDRRSFSDALERGNVIASESNNVVRLGFDDSHLMLKANAISLGDFQESIDVARTTGSGSSNIAFNVKLLLDVVKIVEQSDLVIRFNDELSPCVIQTNESDSFYYIIMPIRTNEFQNQTEEETVSQAV